MGTTRRNFIKFAVGGAAGVGLTPLPFKLMDDVTIWTQNWPWVPIPPEGEFTQVKSVCSLCPGGCGIEVRKVDSRAVKIEGRTDYPVNPGGICPLGMGGLQLLYDKGLRHTGPKKRVGPRGEGTYMEITWDEALSELSGRISGLRNEGRVETLAAVDGNPIGSTMSLMVERLITAAGSPNYLRIPSLEETYRMGNILMQGAEGPMAYDLENADYVLSFGSGLLEGWGAPGRVMNAWGLWREEALEGKARVVQIESRASNTASKADQWVAPRPGTDAALALGLAHVIIKNKLYDDEFINNYCSGFDKWSSMVQEGYSPDKVAKITGLNSGDIKSLAKAFATAKAAIAIYGKGKGTLNGSLHEFMAVHSLNALKGNINRPGGVLLTDSLPLTPLPDIKTGSIARKGLKNPRLDQAGTTKYPFARSLINNLTEAIIESHKSPVDTLLVFSANPAHTLPDGGAFKKALEKIPFVVSFSPFQDETSYMADLILPDHTYLEKMDDIVWPTGLQYPLYGLSRPVVKPLYNTRHTGDAIIQVAKQVDQSTGASFPWQYYEEVLKERAKGLFDAGGGLVSYDGTDPAWKWQGKKSSPKSGYGSFSDMWKKIRSGGLWYRPVRPSLFRTPTFNFFSTKEIPKSDVDRSTYPLRMLPYELINLASGWVPSPPFLYKTIFDHQLLGNESFAGINPKTAFQYGLRQGDRVIIKSPVGEVLVRANIFEGAMPGIVYLPLGFGHTAYDEFIRGKGANPNDIIHAGKDPLSGHPVWWDTPVKLIKV
jgi:anaerobic selenocysteine-containing dehydrogenase